MKRFFLVWTMAGLVSLPTAVVACELDGLSHGYGPLSAMFAGAHRYQSLNGTDEPEEETPAAQVEAASPSTGNAAQPPAPRRSFVAWAKAKPKAAGAAEVPASWVPSSARRSTDPSGAAPQGAKPDQREQRQSPPSGGPVP